METPSFSHRQHPSANLVSGIDGMLACRNLYSWSDWHGGEAIGVKMLEVANLPALMATVIVSIVASRLGSTISACGWSWVLAGVFLVFASAQWWPLGRAIDKRRKRAGCIASRAR